MFTFLTQTNKTSTYETIDGFTRIYDKSSRSRQIECPNDKKDLSKTMNYEVILSDGNISRKITKDQNGFLSVTYMYKTSDEKEAIPFIKCLDDGSLEIIKDQKDEKKSLNVSFTIDKNTSETLMHRSSCGQSESSYLNYKGFHFNFHSEIRGTIYTSQENEVCVCIIFPDYSHATLYSNDSLKFVDDKLSSNQNEISVMFYPTGEIEKICNGEVVDRIYPHSLNPTYKKRTIEDCANDNNKNPNLNASIVNPEGNTNNDKCNLMKPKDLWLQSYTVKEDSTLIKS